MNIDPQALISDAVLGLAVLYLRALMAEMKWQSKMIRHLVQWATKQGYQPPTE